MDVEPPELAHNPIFLQAGRQRCKALNFCGCSPAVVVAKTIGAPFFGSIQESQWRVSHR
jgi:hypothetical protein